MPPQLLPTHMQLQVAAMSGGTGGHPTFRGFLKASGQAEVWDDTDKKKFDQVFLMFALCKVHTQDDLTTMHTYTCTHSYTHTYTCAHHSHTHMHHSHICNMHTRDCLITHFLSSWLCYVLLICCCYSMCYEEHTPQDTSFVLQNQTYTHTHNHTHIPLTRTHTHTHMHTL